MSCNREDHNGEAMKGLEEGINKAIDYCIEHDILSDFLKNNRSDVIDSVIYEYAFDRLMDMEEADTDEDGLEEEIEKHD